MKNLIIAILFLCGMSVKSQVNTPITPTVYGTNVNRLKPLLVLNLPQKDTGAAYILTNDTTAQIFYRYADSSFWGYSKAKGFFKVGNNIDTSLLVHKSGVETITGKKTISDTALLSIDIPTTDSGYKLINSKFAKQIFAQKVAGVFPLYSIPVANSSGQLSATSDFTYNTSASQLNIGYAGFYSSSSLHMHGDNGVITAGGSGMDFLAQGGYPVDPSKSLTFHNSGYQYLKMYTTGVVGTWDHFTEFDTRHFSVRGLGADSAYLTNTGTVHMLTVDATGQFNHQAIPTGISLTSLSATSPIFYNNTTGVFSSQAATASLNGYLTSTDWNFFNGKQDALLNPITGNSTTLNYLTKIIGTNSVGNSGIYDNGTTVGINTATPDASARLDVTSITKGVLIPRLNTTQMNGIVGAASGLMVVNTDSAYRLFIYNGVSWVGFLRYLDLPSTTLNSDAALLFTVTSGIFSVNSQTANKVWRSGNAGGIPSFSALTGADLGITLTTTGTSGASTWTPSTATLNIPQYAGGDVYQANANTFTALNIFKSVAVNESPVLNSESLTTGSGTNWTGTGYSTGYTHATTSTVALVSTFTSASSTVYKVVITISGRTAGSVIATMGGWTSATLSANATTITGPKTTSATTLSITPTTDFDGIVVVSVKQISSGSSPTTQWQTSAGTTTFDLRAPFQTSQFVGYGAGRNFIGVGTNAEGNTSNGYLGMANLTTGIANTSNGYLSLSANNIGNWNTGDGYGTLSSNTTGNGSSATGMNALFSNTTGTFHVAHGYGALYSELTDNFDVAEGAQALTNMSSGSQVTALGGMAGRYISGGSTAMTTANNSLFLGYGTMPLANSQTNQTVIGYNAVGLGSNTNVLGNSSSVTTGLWGRTVLGLTTMAADNGVDMLQVPGTITATGIKTNGSSSMTAASSAINTTETILTSNVIPANMMLAGTTFRVTVYGTNTSTVANASNIRVRLGTAGTSADAVVAVVTPTSAASGTAVPFMATFDVVIRTTGSGGTAAGNGVLQNNGVTGINAISGSLIGTPTSAVAVNTTVSNTIQVSYVSAATTTTSTFQTATIEVVKL